MEPVVSRAHGNLRSIYAMLIAVSLFSLMDTAMKLLSEHYPAMQVAALRALTSLPLVLGYVGWRGGLGSMLKIRWSFHLLRAALGIAMLALFAYGLQTLSLAEAYTLFFIAPALITALSVLLLKERVNLARWIAIAVGLGGVLVVLRPSGDGVFTLGGLAVLGAAAMYAVSAVSTRILARTDRSEHIVLWLMLLISIGASALAAPGWVPLRPGDTPVLVALALSGFLGQLAITEAFGSGEASKVAPFEYAALAWGVGFDWLLWHTLPDRYTVLGAAIIIGSGIYLIRHEGAASQGEPAGAVHP
ncbi:MAG: EamA family transporter [Massilia sp.]|jgi:drug/metabolite transporter (DMT)-like permease|nr:EamA family transporter [Massilia sp.]MDB5948877.1 EamA family transporter [Massilia sp.]